MSTASFYANKHFGPKVDEFFQILAANNATIPDKTRRILEEIRDKCCDCIQVTITSNKNPTQVIAWLKDRGIDVHIPTSPRQTASLKNMALNE